MERRAYPRVEVSHTVLYFTDFYPRPTVASTLDLSLGGTKIQSLYGLSSAEGLRLSIAIQPQVLKTRGKVVHVSERESGRVEAGIQFEKMSENDHHILKQYLFQVMEQQALESFSGENTPH
ncbi:MAG: hypothetical protein GTN81_16175 [Proteobacteria bacterium]|nr:hypothetical protein [Pseudomonadota bacterium]